MRYCGRDNKGWCSDRIMKHAHHRKNTIWSLCARARRAELMRIHFSERALRGMLIDTQCGGSLSILLANCLNVPR